MRKLLSIAVIISGVVFSDMVEADSTLLIERLQQEGMLAPEPNILFKNAGEKPQSTTPAVPLLTPSSPATQVKNTAVVKKSCATIGTQYPETKAQHSAA